MDCSSDWHSRADFSWIFRKSPGGALHQDCCWSGGALFHLGCKHTHTEEGLLIMQQWLWWTKIGGDRKWEMSTFKSACLAGVWNIVLETGPLALWHQYLRGEIQHWCCQSWFSLCSSHPFLWSRRIFYQAISLGSVTGGSFCFPPFLAPGEREQN